MRLFSWGSIDYAPVIGTNRDQVRQCLASPGRKQLLDVFADQLRRVPNARGIVPSELYYERDADHVLGQHWAADVAILGARRALQQLLGEQMPINETSVMLRRICQRVFEETNLTGDAGFNLIVHQALNEVIGQISLEDEDELQRFRRMFDSDAVRSVLARAGFETLRAHYFQ